MGFFLEYIKVTKLKQLYSDSYDKNSLDLKIGNRIRLTFDEFFDVKSLYNTIIKNNWEKKNLFHIVIQLLAADIIDKKQRFGNVEFDSQSSDIQCVLCPYAVDTS